MSYREWFLSHAQKHKNIVDRLVAQNYTKEAIIDYFQWENLKEAEKSFCPLFAAGDKCHPIEELNCYLCACPNFRFNDQKKSVKSYCSIDSKEGKQMEFDGMIHQDCSGCIVPHRREYIQKHFDTDWRKMMQKCDEGE